MGVEQDAWWRTQLQPSAGPRCLLSLCTVGQGHGTDTIGAFKSLSQCNPTLIIYPSEAHGCVSGEAAAAERGEARPK